MEGVDKPINPDGGLMICPNPNCGAIMGRRQGRGKFSYFNRQGGKQNQVGIEGDQVTIRCNKCGFGHIFVNVIERVGIGEAHSSKISLEGA